jgi:hypothetical protein
MPRTLPDPRSDLKKADIHPVTRDRFGDFSARALLLRIYDVSPYVFYLILKDWFGPPTYSEQSWRSQWDYLLFTPHLALNVYEWKMDSVSVAVYARVEISDEEIQWEAKEFIELIRKQTRKYVAKVSSARSRAAGLMIRNPFQMYFNTAEELIKLSQEEALNTLEKWGTPEKLYRAAFFLYEAALEGLLNLIYEIYLDPLLRNEQISSRLQREQIDIKLRLAPLYCTCFKPGLIDDKTEEFRKFKAIVELRNKFIHANITEPMKSPIIVEDGLEFWIWDPKFGKYDLPGSAEQLTIDHLEFVRQAIWNMADTIINMMKAQYGRIFAQIITHEILRVENKGDELTLVAPPRPKPERRRRKSRVT